MTIYKISINPIDKKISYQIEGDYAEVLHADLNKIKELNTLVNKIDKTIFGKHSSITIEEKTEDMKEKHNRVISIVVPKEIMVKIEQLDDRKKFPILWSFSNQSDMTVSDFLKACAKNGFSLNPSWLPASSGNFATLLVKRDKMFHMVGRKGKEKTWKLTNMGILKIESELKNLKSING